MADPLAPVERYGKPYWLCPSCPYGSFHEDDTRAHLRDHEPRPTLDEVLAARAAPAKPPKRKE